MIVQKIKCDVCTQETDKPNGSWIYLNPQGGFSVDYNCNRLLILGTDSIIHLCSPACYRAFFNSILDSLIPKEVPSAPIQMD